MWQDSASLQEYTVEEAYPRTGAWNREGAGAPMPLKSTGPTSASSASLPEFCQGLTVPQNVDQAFGIWASGDFKDLNHNSELINFFSENIC